MTSVDALIREHCPEGVPFVPLGTLGTWSGGGTPSKSRPEFWKDGTIPWVSPKDMGGVLVDSAQDHITEAAVRASATKLVPSPAIVMVVRSSILDHTFPTALTTVPVALNQDMKAVVPYDNLLPGYLAHVLRANGQAILRAARKTGGSVASIDSGKLRSFRIPVPPQAVQREIVRILDHFTELEAELEAEMEARRLQFLHVRATVFADVDSHMEPLGAIARNLDGRRRPVTKAARIPGPIPYYGASGVVDYVRDFIFDGEYLLVSEDGANLLARSSPIAFSVTGKPWTNNHAHVLEFESSRQRRFVEFYLNSIDLTPFVSGESQPKLNQANLNRIPIPTPPAGVQEQVVEVLSRLDALVNDLSVGLPAELAARRRQYEYYRDKLLTFEEKR